MGEAVERGAAAASGDAGRPGVGAARRPVLETETPHPPHPPSAGGAPHREPHGHPHRGSTRAERSRHDWAWRRRLRERPATNQAYRVAVGALGACVVILGLALVPLPGPGWLVVFLGFGILASEFHWARRMHAFVTRHVRRWNDWIMGQSWLVRFACAAGTFVFVVACFWVLFKLAGLPGFVPEWAAHLLRTYAAL